MNTQLLTDKQYDNCKDGYAISRQGDVVLFKPFKNINFGNLINESQEKRVVLAYGEVTGHAHAFYDQDRTILQKEIVKKGFELYELQAESSLKYNFAYTKLPSRLLRLNERSLLRHEEHDPHSLPPRDFVVVIQHEGDEIKELRRVAD